MSQLSLKGEKNLSPIRLMIVISWINEGRLLPRASESDRDRCKNWTPAVETAESDGNRGIGQDTSKRNRFIDTFIYFILFYLFK